MRALAPSPLARLLLDLHERRADGALDLGGRRVVLKGGDVVDVKAATGDEDLLEFVQRAGRIDIRELDLARRDVAQSGATPEEALLRNTRITRELLTESRRALWLDRLVRGIAQVEDESLPVPPFVPSGRPSQLEARPRKALSEPPPSSDVDEPIVGLLRLLLDALARRAAVHDAGAVGGRPDHRVEWLETPYTPRARKWADLATTRDGVMVAQLLGESPAVAAQLAALVRAGVARLVPARADAPAPPPRILSMPPVAMDGTAPLGPVSLLPPPKPPEVRLDPGASPGLARDVELRAPLRELPRDKTPISDPLDALEAQVQQLEQSRAPGAERAQVFVKIARTWQSRYQSIEEAARAYREAASADPGDRNALAEAAVLCAALGEVELARAYSRSAAHATPPGDARAAQLERVALLAFRAGDATGAQLHLEEAAAEKPADPRPLELLVRLCTESLDEPAAAQAAKQAAARLAGRSPERARALLEIARRGLPEDVELALAEADALEADGLPEAAVQTLHGAARRATDPEARRRLRMDAADRSDRAGRPEDGAALLLDAFEEEPSLEAVYETLAAALGAGGPSVDLSVVAEEIAAAAPEESRAEWFVRAAEAHAALGGGEWALYLLGLALCMDPASERALAAVRAAGVGRDPLLAADALERAVGLALEGPHPAAPALLEALAALEEARIDGAGRALWALELLLSIAPDDLGASARVELMRGKARLAAGLLEQADRELAAQQADAGAPRLAALRKVGALLLDMPAERARAVAVWSEVYAAQPDDAGAASTLERLLALVDDRDGLAAHLQARAEGARSPMEKARLFVKVAQVHTARGDLVQVRDACLRALEVQPGQREALSRLLRAARRLGDLDTLALALDRRAQSEQGRPRADSLVTLARLHDSREDFVSALQHALDALSADPRSAAAAQLVVQYASTIAPGRALPALSAARAVLGDSVDVLAATYRAAEAASDARAAVEPLDAWVRVAPYDPAPAQARLALRVRAGDVRGVVACAEDVLAPEAWTPHTADSLLAAVDALAARGAVAEAVSLGIRALDRVGATEQSLRDRVVTLAAALGDRNLHAAALERWIGATKREARLEPLRRLAELHAAAADRAAEARAHLRTLAVSLHHEPSLQRLEVLYREAGQAERLLAVLALRLEIAIEPEARRNLLFDLLSASAQLAADGARAEGFADALLAESEGDEAWCLRAVGALVTMGRPVAAVERLLALAETAPAELAPRFAERAVLTAEVECADLDLALRTASLALELCPTHGPLLLAFERLCLHMGDSATAERMYGKLADLAMGPHGRRAILYRAARYFERAGEPQRALVAYRAAFDLQPTAGVNFASIERLSAQSKDYEPLVHALTVLASRAPNPDARIGLLKRASDVLDTQVGDQKRAFDALFEAWDTVATRDLEAQLRALATRLREKRPEDGDACRERLLEGLRSRAEQAWDAEDRAMWLTRAARVLAEDRQDVDATMALVRDIAKAVHECTEEQRAAAATGLLAVLEVVADRNDEAKRLADECREIIATAPPPEFEMTPTKPSEATPAAAASDAVTVVGGPSPEPTGSAALPDSDTVPASGTGPDSATVTDSATVPDSAAVPVSVSVPEPASGPASVPIPSSPLVSAPFPPSPSIPAPPSASTEPSSPRFRSTQKLGVYVDPPPPAPDAATVPGAPSPAALAAMGSTDGEVPNAPIVEEAARDNAPLTRSELADEPTPAAHEPLALSLSEDATETQLREAADAGDADAAEALAALLAEDPTRLPEASFLLRRVIRNEPTRTSALRALVSVALARNSRVEALVAAEILSIVDGTDAPVARPVARVVGDEPRALDRADENILAVLALVWDTAAPLFRKTLPELGVLGTDRVSTLTQSPLARAYSAALQTLDLAATPLFVRAGHGNELSVVPTAPPAVLAGNALDGTEDVLRFRVGRAIDRSRSAHVLLASLSPQAGRSLVGAIVAAYGPADAGLTPTREAQTLAADLWGTMPARAQRQARDLLAQAPTLPTYESARDAIDAASARAGLLVAGSFRSAALGLAIDDPAARILREGNEPSWAAACRDSVALVQLVRFALSDAFLSARARL